MENVSHNTSFSADDGDMDNRPSSLRRGLHEFWGDAVGDHENIISTPLEGQTSVKKSSRRGHEGQEVWTLGSQRSRGVLRISRDGPAEASEASANNFFTINEVQEPGAACLTSREPERPVYNPTYRPTFGTVALPSHRDHWQLPEDKVPSQFGHTMKSSLGVPDSENMDHANSTFDRGQFVQREAKLISQAGRGASRPKNSGVVLNSNQRLMQRLSLPNVPTRLSGPDLAESDAMNDNWIYNSKTSKGLQLAPHESTLTSVVRDELKMTQGSQMALQGALGQGASYQISRRNDTTGDNTAQNLRNLLSRHGEAPRVFVHLEENNSEAESNMIPSSDDEDAYNASRLQSSEVLSASYIDPEGKQRLSLSYNLLDHSNRQPSQKSIHVSASGGVGKKRKTALDNIQSLSQIGKLESGQHIQSIFLANDKSREQQRAHTNNQSLSWQQVVEMTKEMEKAENRRRRATVKHGVEAQRLARLGQGFAWTSEKLGLMRELRSQRQAIKRLGFLLMKARCSRNDTTKGRDGQGLRTGEHEDQSHINQLLAQQQLELGKSSSFKSLGANQYQFQQDQVLFLLT